MRGLFVVLLILSFSFQYVLSDADAKLEDADDVVNASEFNSSRSTEVSFANMIDRALEKEFNETDAKSDATDPRSFNNSVADQEAVLKTVARVKPKKNETKEEKSFQLHDVFHLENDNGAEDTPTLIDRKINEKQMEIFEATEDNYGGVTVNMKKEEPMDSHKFHTMLMASISHWRQKGKKGVWIKLPIELAHLVEAAVKEGFWYHHAETTYLMLVYWIPETPHTLPANASHRVGIGALVLNNNGEVLVVKEKSGKSTGIWKLPTGVVEEGEDICMAAIREVQEETGIETEFIEILAFRQSHKSFFGKSDLFFICMLKPLNLTIHKQNAEIEEAQWMAIEEYAAQPKLNQSELSKNIAKICLAKKDNQYTGFSPVLTTTGLSAKKCYLYCNIGSHDH